VRDDPWLEGPTWRNTVLEILQVARARVVAIADGGYSASVAFHHLQTLLETFRANAFARQTVAAPGGRYPAPPDPARQHGWSRAMSLIAWFLNGRQEP
jgi:hypothetical protein